MTDTDPSTSPQSTETLHMRPDLAAMVVELAARQGLDGFSAEESRPKPGTIENGLIKYDLREHGTSNTGSKVTIPR